MARLVTGVVRIEKRSVAKRFRSTDGNMYHSALGANIQQKAINRANAARDIFDRLGLTMPSNKNVVSINRLIGVLRHNPKEAAKFIKLLQEA
ncbi:hypothetical protein [Stenotrophomonas phage RAS14]